MNSLFNVSTTIIIDYIDYIDCLPMVDFHRLGDWARRDYIVLNKLENELSIDLTSLMTKTGTPKTYENEGPLRKRRLYL